MATCQYKTADSLQYNFNNYFKWLLCIKQDYLVISGVLRGGNFMLLANLAAKRQPEKESEVLSEL